jgi:hypothetical protein
MQLFSFHRNRYEERVVHSLPVRSLLGLKDVDSAIDFLDLTSEETQFMVNNRTLELPSNFFRYFVRNSKAFCTLQYVAFQVRDKFPNNIVRLRSGEVMYITEVESSVFEPDDAVNGTVKEVHLIHGKLFKEVQVI